MTGSQRVLIYRLGIVFLTGLTFLILFFAAPHPAMANAAWAWLALLAFERRVRGKEVVDERDREILLRASIAGYTVFWIVFVLACVIPAVAAPEETIPLEALAWVPMAGYCLLELVRSSAGLLFYARGA